MSNSTITPNMNLVVPTVGQEPGPQYATDVNTSLNIIDQHNHSPGSGVAISPLAMNINTGLTFNGNFATNLGGATLATQSVTPANKTVYSKGNDLYFVDALGNNIQITQNGGIAGTSGSISNLVAPASAAYVAIGATFVWQSGVNIAANMDFGSAILRNISPNSTFGLTLAPPAALSNDYTITLPTLPGSNLPLSINSSGTMSAALVTGAQIANTTISAANIVNNTITATQMANNTVTASQIANSTITTTQISASAGIVGTQLANNTVGHAQLAAPVYGSYTIGSAIYGNGNNLVSPTLTTIGGPLFVALSFSSVSGTAFLGGGISANLGSQVTASLDIYMDNVFQFSMPFMVNSPDGGTTWTIYGLYTTSGLTSAPGAGAHTIQIRYNAGTSGVNLDIQGAILNVFEIK